MLEWTKQLLVSASRVFEDRNSKPSAQDRRHEAELQRLKNVIAEITAENLELKKRLSGLEDHGQLPPELQRRVHQEVERTTRRSGWPMNRKLAAVGIAWKSYYRWLREEDLTNERPAKPPPPASHYEALSEEKQAVIAYARKHPELRHRELAWRMVDEGVAYVSPSTVYRILAGG